MKNNPCRFLPVMLLFPFIMTSIAMAETNTFTANTAIRGRMFGKWNDYGRLITESEQQ